MLLLTWHFLSGNRLCRRLGVGISISCSTLLNSDGARFPWNETHSELPFDLSAFHSTTIYHLTVTNFCNWHCFKSITYIIIQGVPYNVTNLLTREWFYVQRGIGSTKYNLFVQDLVFEKIEFENFPGIHVYVNLVN